MGRFHNRQAMHFIRCIFLASFFTLYSGENSHKSSDGHIKLEDPSLLNDKAAGIELEDTDLKTAFESKLPKGHLQPYGESGRHMPVKTVTRFPDKSKFWINHVVASEPLIIKGASSKWPAFSLWTDAYLKKKEASYKKETGEQKWLTVEPVKKEIRGLPAVSMTMKKFLEKYNKTELFLNDEVPVYMEKDINIPELLQRCTHARATVFSTMWLSSGGSSSVIHTDSKENFLCMVRGRKRVFLTEKFARDKSIKLQLSGAYSELDVDAVDLIKEPRLINKTFYVADIEAGDCLYIPYLWIHQVRSYDSNVAVSIWWEKVLDAVILDSELCSGDEAMKSASGEKRKPRNSWQASCPSSESMAVMWLHQQFGVSLHSKMTHCGA